MTNPQALPVILISCLSACILIGLMVLGWGRKLPRQGDWLAGLGLLGLIALATLGIEDLMNAGGQPQFWQRGWIWPHSETGALTVGVLEDPLGLCFSMLTALTALLALLGKPLLGTEENRDQALPGNVFQGGSRLNSAIVLSAAGVCLCWLSLTPWLPFLGLALTIGGGFLSLSPQWEADDEAPLAIRYVWERAGGLLLAILGACGLAGTRAALTFVPGAVGSWFPDGAGPFESIGAALLLAGLLIQLHPFPFTGWLVSPTRAPSWPRVLLTQIFPAWAAFALLLRLQPQLDGLPVFQALGWCMLASTVLSGASGLLQAEWKSGLSAWVGAGLTLSAAILAFTGPEAALSMLLGVSLGSLALAAAARVGSGAGKAAAVLATAAASGLVGFVSAAGGLRWLAQASQQPALLATSLPVFFVFVALSSKQLWTLLRTPSSNELSWTALATPYLLIALSLGIVWTGSISAGALPGDLDRVLPSILSILCGSAQPAASVDQVAFVAGSGAFWAALVLGLGAGYWASLKLQGPPTQAIAQVIARGYGVDKGARKVLAAISWAARRCQWLVDEKIWRTWVPDAVDAAVHAVASWVSRADRELSRFSRQALSSWIEAPAQFLQLVQSGDVQWYLIIALGSGLAILAHFLRF